MIPESGTPDDVPVYRLFSPGNNTKNTNNSMKKALITILALGGLASAAAQITLQDGVSFTTPSITLNPEWKTGGASVTLLLDVDNFAALFTKATSSARPVFVSMSGAGSRIIGLEAHEGKRITGADGVAAGGVYNNLYSMAGGDGDSVSAVNWENVTFAALTMALETGNAGTAWSLTVLNKDGTYTNRTANYNSLRWADMGDITDISVDPSVVTQAYAFDGHISGAAAFALNQAAIGAAVPEPAAATLSLLALAGLTARRRRR